MAERWFSSTVALRPGTRRTCRLLLDHQVLPHFGGTPLASIDPLAVHAWQAGLVAAGSARAVSAVAEAGLPHSLRVHDLRHTAASLAIRENASVKIVHAMLGHRSATQTLDRYGHLYPSDLDASPSGSTRRMPPQRATKCGPRGGPDVVQLRKRPGQ